ncbi:uncharacterized protein LOC135682177 isoform X1 [Rhopilema esculentum]|uniref:uncharacterized protein LOC135682177 isoform X1 n=1 Tax=Rhopilema esculentum TaxID=499914 RepID=UPI0031D86F63|eukprot:gene14033-5009_t
MGRLNLVAVDSSQHSDRAFTWYIENYHREGDTLGIVHIHQLPSLPAMGLYAGGAVLSEGYQMMVNESVEQSKTVADKYIEQCKEKNIKHVLFLQTAENDAGQTIVKIARENNANTLVMGSRGLGTVRRTLLGSVSDYVLHHAHIPTCVIPPTIEEAK